MYLRRGLAEPGTNGSILTAQAAEPLNITAAWSSNVVGSNGGQTDPYNGIYAQYLPNTVIPSGSSQAGMISPLTVPEANEVIADQEIDFLGFKTTQRSLITFALLYAAIYIGHGATY